MRFIVDRKVLISMIFIGLTLMGIVSYKQLKVELFPNAQAPYLVVQVSAQTEVDPGYMEKQAVIPLEGAIGGLPGIEELTSTAAQRRGVITVSYTPNTDLKYAQLKLQERIDEVRATLPEGFTVSVQKVDLQQAANQIMSMEVRGTGGVNRVRQLTDEKITKRIENIDGIAGVTVFGGQEKTLEITLNKDACDAYGITPFQVRNAITQNGRDRTYVGNAYSGNRIHFIHVSSDYTDTREIENLVIKEQGPVLLRDVASVYFGVKEQTTYSRVNGMESVTMNLVADAQVNMIELSASVTKVVEQLNKELGPLELEVKIQENSAETMKKNIDENINLAITGGLLAIFILWIFLKKIRLVLSIALSIPISVYVAFNFFYAAGITLNSLSLVGMALAIGMLVDNSVVVLENIYRHASRNERPDLAVVQGTKEVWRSVFASTLTTVTVFLPFLFSDDYLIRILGMNIGISIISTLLISMMVALVLIPMLTHFILKKRPHDTPPVFERVHLHQRMIQIYVLILKSSLRNPAVTVVGGMVLFFVSLFGALAVSTNTLKEAESREVRVTITMPQGTTLDNTDIAVRTIEERLMDLPEKEEIVTETQEATATVKVTLVEKYQKIKDRKLPEIKSDIERRIQNIPQVEYEFQQFSTSSGFSGGGGGASAGMPSGGGMESLMGIGVQQEKVLIKGQDFNLMKAVGEDIQYYLQDLTTVLSANLSVQDNRPEVRMDFNTREMGERNVALNSVMSELSSFPTEFSTGVTFKQAEEEYDILIKYEQKVKEEEEENQTRSMSDLQEMDVPSADGARHRLTDLARVYFAFGMGTINRLNQEKQIQITYRFDAETNGSKPLLEAARAEVDNLVASLSIPAGVAVEVQHEENQFQEFYFLIAAAFILIFMIMAAVFESLSTPFVLLFSIPLAGIGAFLALLFTKNSLINFNTLTGFIILIGIVVNNGIILIDYTNILRKRGTRKTRALLTAGLARLRPILITAGTTIVAMIPMAMGKSEYGSLIAAPFAITVIGGLTVSTILTLVFIPTFYSGLENSLAWMRSQTTGVKIVMYGLMIGLSALVYFTVDAFLWQLIEILLVITGVPASVWFVLNSLKKASDKVIPENEPIVIKVQNLVKIYERDGRFARQWKAGLAIRERFGMEKEYKTWKDMENMIWQLPILGFMIYFVFFFLESGFWTFLLSIPVWFMMISIYVPIRKFITSRKFGRIADFLNRSLKFLIFWGFPAFCVIFFHTKWQNIALDVIIGFLWYLGLIIYTTSNRLAREQVNVNRIKGRFGRIRRGWYRMVQAIPVIGSKRKPFKALKGVSMEMENGMFGLLGPNGAGKTTLMRIICGILEQSYGKIWISGVDTQEKREELQGLIGYLPQEFGMYENMTAGEYLHYQGILKGLKDPVERTVRVDYVLTSVHMIEHKDEKIGSYSGGMKQRIGIAQILLHLPRILVVDEPTAGLDPRERIRFRNLLVELARDRVVIFSTHIIEDISSSCNRVAVLDKGDLVYLGVPEDMALTAQGHVWQVEVGMTEFDELSEKYKVVYHMRDGQKIRVRLLAEEKPSPDAIPVQPLLEDSYLWMLKKVI
jgi:multidrug efflux pump subunit AcrB/ABC-type multidrug transport system ATPase subunit